MQKKIAAGARAMMLGLALLCAVSGPSAAAQDESDIVRAAEEQSDAELEAEIRQAHSAFDRYARTLSKKKRSELINLKSYTDEEWAQHERDVKANNAACLKRDAVACFDAGRAYENGDGVWIVLDIAYILYNDACNLGLGEGCRAFYDLAHTGWGYPEGGVQAADGMLEKGCTAGDLVSCASFAMTLRDGTAANIARSDAVLESACTAGGAEACLALAEILSDSGEPEDAGRAAAILDATCATPNADACAAIADRQERQPGADPSQTNRAMHYACYLGRGEYCEQMGKRAWRGIGMVADRDAAVRYFAEACAIFGFGCETPRLLAGLPQYRAGCERGDTAACADLGVALADYASPEYDLAQAAPLLERGCLAGVGRACVVAANAGNRVNGELADTERASALYEAGCAADALDACFELARFLASTPDPARVERAAAIYSRLCDAQYRSACIEEERLVGLVPTARILPAGENFTPPLPREDGGNLLAPAEIMEVCFTGSERFRGKTYEHFTCDRGEKGINSDRARPGQAPWQALLWRPAEMFDTTLSPAQRVLCGGSLIAQGWILTAAHCLNDEGNDLRTAAGRAEYRIRLGVFDPTTDEGISYPILRVIPHEDFNPGSRYEFDIALIQYDTVSARPGTNRAFANPIRTITVDPLAVGTRPITAGMPVYAFGWGWTAAENSSTTNYLQIIKMALSSPKTCAAVTGFAKAITNAALCAKGKNNEQTCFADSGGPLVYYGDPSARPVLIGVVSAGAKCGTSASKRPSQYTRVAMVRDWIARHVPGIR